MELFKWWEKEKSPWEMTSEEKLAAAAKAKASGTEHFKAGNFVNAIEDYKKGLDLVKDMAQGEEEADIVGQEVGLDISLASTVPCCCPLTPSSPLSRLSLPLFHAFSADFSVEFSCALCVFPMFVIAAQFISCWVFSQTLCRRKSRRSCALPSRSTGEG